MAAGTIGRLFFISILLWAHSRVSAQDFVPEWIRFYSPSPGRSARATTLALSPAGNLVVAGSEENAERELDYSFVTYDRTGERLGATSYTSSRSKNSIVSAIHFDGAGELLATGSSDTIELDLAGHLSWIAPYGGSAITSDGSFAYTIRPGSMGGSTLQIGNDVRSPVDVILDADPGADPDDMSDIAILNNLMTRGEVNILAVMGSHTSPHMGAAIQIMNRYHSHTNIPVGMAMNGPFIGESYGWFLWHKYFASPGFNLSVPDATKLYRQILNSRADHSVTIIFSGQLRNLLNLWNSAPDNISALSGRALLEKKAKRLVVVAGYFAVPPAEEYNLATDVEGAMFLNHITNSIPITFVGIEQGDPIYVPSQGVRQMDTNNPVRYAHEIAGYTNRPSWAGVGILFAARGFEWKGERYFTSKRGRATITANGWNSFAPDENSNQEYVIRTQGVSRFVDILDDLLLTGPHIVSLPPDSDRTGRQIWSRRFQEVPRWAAEPQTLRADASGNIYVGGIEASSDDNSSNHFVLHKYGEAGWLRWRARSSGIAEPPRSKISVRSMEVSDDSAWLFGQYGESGVLFRFSNQGAQLWHYQFSGHATAAQMAVDNAGVACIVLTQGNTMHVRRIGSDGRLLNEAEHQISDADWIEVEAMTLDQTGSVFIAVRASKKGINSLLLAGGNSTLSQISTAALPSRHPGEARATGIITDNDRNVYLTGYAPTADGGTEMVTAKFTASFKMEPTDAGGLRLKCFVAANEKLTIEATQDLKDWEIIATRQAATAGFLEVDEPTALALPARFYRISRQK